MSCKHTQPFTGNITLKPPPYTCLFCHVEELEKALAAAHAENLAFNLKVAEEINEARRDRAYAEQGRDAMWKVVDTCRDLLGCGFGDDIREAIKNLNAEVATLRSQRDATIKKAETEHKAMLERLKKITADNEWLKAHNDTLAREAVVMRGEITRLREALQHLRTRVLDDPLCHHSLTRLFIANLAAAIEQALEGA